MTGPCPLCTGEMQMNGRSIVSRDESFRMTPYRCVACGYSETRREELRAMAQREGGDRDEESAEAIVGWPWTLLSNIDELCKRAQARNLSLSLIPSPGDRWYGALGGTQTPAPLSREEAIGELERMTR